MIHQVPMIVVYLLLRRSCADDSRRGCDRRVCRRNFLSLGKGCRCSARFSHCTRKVKIYFIFEGPLGDTPVVDDAVTATNRFIFDFLVPGSRMSATVASMDYSPQSERVASARRATTLSTHTFMNVVVMNVIFLWK